MGQEWDAAVAVESVQLSLRDFSVAHGISMETLTERLLHRVGVDRDFFTDVAPDNEGDTRHILAAASRLEEFRRIYTETNLLRVEHTVWNAQNIRDDLPLGRFRGDCVYVWQRRDLNTPAAFALTYFYMVSLGYTGKLVQCGEDGAFGAQVHRFQGIPVSRDLMDSILEIDFVTTHLGPDIFVGGEVLDIGSGYGRFAHRLLQMFPAVECVYCADAVPESNFLCERYLHYRGLQEATRVLPHPLTRAIVGLAHIQIAVNIHSFSECSLDSIRWWLDTLCIGRIPYLLIVPNSDGVRGKRLLSKEGDGSRKDFYPLLCECGYRLETSRAKYPDPEVQRYGVSPTWYYLFVNPSFL